MFRPLLPVMVAHRMKKAFANGLRHAAAQAFQSCETLPRYDTSQKRHKR